MKLEVRMYVRTKKYGIAKIICGTSNKFNIDVFKKDGCTLRCQKERDILKASFNIIDLIEVGDYVNGYKVEEVNNNLKGICNSLDTYLWVVNDLDEFEEILIFEKDIKSVITHEQIEQIKYKVGE